jgi:hypothetical protein
MGMQQLRAPRHVVGRPRTMRRHALPALALAQAMLMLVGCSPQYRTFASYTPPATDNGRQCVAQCLDMRRTCRGQSDQEIEQCRVSAQRDALAETVLRQAAYQIDRQQHEAGKAEAPSSHPAVVQPNYRRCDQQAGNLAEQCSADFDLCYQNCGGAIDYSTQCVANCD